MKKLVYGIGKNDADYPVSNYNTDGKQTLCPYYSRWKNILLRIKSSKTDKRFNSYKGVKICEEWVYFSNFKKWMETKDWEGKEIDKDILSKGDKLYSPSTCCFVTSETNCMFNEGINGYEKETGIPIGVKRFGKKFVAQICNKKHKETIGYFDCKNEAHRAWQEKKIKYIISALLNNDECSDAKAGVFKILKKLCNEYDLNIETKYF